MSIRVAIEAAMVLPTPPNFNARVLLGYKQSKGNDHDYACREKKCIQHEVSMSHSSGANKWALASSL